MTVHIVKLCVGAVSVDDLEVWQAARLDVREARGERRPMAHHDTRMSPKRRDDVLDAGSLYWVICGQILVRQVILDLEEIVDAEARSACRIWLDPALVRTEPRGRRPFQGWRYLQPADAPPDLGDGAKGVPLELADKLKDNLVW